MSDRGTRLAGLYAVIAAGVALVVSPLLALSYFATAEGMQELGSGTVSAWAHPGRDLVGGLLTWASPDRVYGACWLLFRVLFAAVFFCARAVHAQRPPDLLVLVLPSMVVLPVVLGNLSLGLLMVLIAWAATGWRLRRTGTTAGLAAAAAR